MNSPSKTEKKGVRWIWVLAIVICHLSFVIAPQAAQATTYYVSTAGSNGNNGLTAGTAWRTVTYAVGQATTSGDIIRVAAGSYQTETFPFTISSGVTVTGESRATTTIEATAAAAAMITMNSSSVLANLTVRGMSTSGGTSSFINMFSSGAEVNNCIIDTGTLPAAADSFAVGIEIRAQSCQVRNSVFYAAGGAVAVSGGADRFNIGVFLGRFAAGAAINTEGAIIEKNEFRDIGVGIWVAANNSGAGAAISKNTLAGCGWSIYFQNTGAGVTGNYTIKNNILASAVSAGGSGGYGLKVDAVISPVINYSYNCTYEAAPDISGGTFNNLGNNKDNQNPLFYWAARKDYRLFSDSPAVGAADDGSNMGAYEGSVAIPAGTYFVSTSGSNDNDGLTAATAFRTITYAVGAPRVKAVNVAAGTYNAAGGESFPITIPSNVRVSGESRSSVTVEASAIAGVITMGTNSTVEGMTVNGSLSAFGTVFTVGSNGADINDCVIRLTGDAGNKFYVGVTVSGASNARLRNSLVYTTDAKYTDPGAGEMNIGVWGGAAPGGAAASVSGLQITGNEIRNLGFGILIIQDTGTGATINNNTVVDNAYGIWLPSGADVGGGPDNAGTYPITNTIVASSDTYGIIRGSGTVTSTYNDVYANAANYTGLSAGTGDISQNPVFVDYAGNDFNLQVTSPCIDAGTPSGTDIGAYSYAGSLAAPTVTVEAPNGGETIAVSSTYNITWSVSSPVGLKASPITLRLSTNSGSSWSLIASGEANDGTYSWAAPSTQLTSCRISVEAEDLRGSVGADRSNSDFSVVAGLPAAPTGLIGTAESTSAIRWSWSHDGSELGGFYLLDTDNAVKATIAAATSANTLEAGLSANTAYTRKVRAYNANGSTDSSTASRYTLASVPTSLAATAISSTEASLAWQGDGTSYRLERSFDGTNYDVIVSGIAPLEPRGAAVYTAGDLLPEKQVWFRVRAVNGDGIVTEPGAAISLSTLAYLTAPIIVSLEIDRHTFFSGDVISTKPKVAAIVRSRASLNRDAAALTFTRASDNKVYGPYGRINYLRTTGENSYEVGWIHGLIDKMEGGNYRINVSLSDAFGNTGTYEASSVIYDEKTTAPALAPGTTPRTGSPDFSPAAGEAMAIGYSLTVPADLQMIIFNQGGREIYRATYVSGEEGAAAGYNVVSWGGRDMSGRAAPRGIYVGWLIAGGQPIGKFYTVVK